MPKSAKREITATHWHNNTLFAGFVPPGASAVPRLRPVMSDSSLFPTLGTNYPQFAIAGTMGNRDA
jgi:hypothetical protein